MEIGKLYEVTKGDEKGSIIEITEKSESGYYYESINGVPTRNSHFSNGSVFIEWLVPYVQTYSIY